MIYMRKINMMYKYNKKTMMVTIDYFYIPSLKFLLNTFFNDCVAGDAEKYDLKYINKKFEIFKNIKVKINRISEKSCVNLELEYQEFLYIEKFMKKIGYKVSEIIDLISDNKIIGYLFNWYSFRHAFPKLSRRINRQLSKGGKNYD